MGRYEWVKFIISVNTVIHLLRIDELSKNVNIQFLNEKGKYLHFSKCNNLLSKPTIINVNPMTNCLFSQNYFACCCQCTKAVVLFSITNIFYLIL